MKKSLLFLSLFIAGITTVNAQCTIANSCTPTNGYCTTPAVGNALPNATETMVYSTTIQVSLASTFSGATITDATVTAITGLPTGLAGSTNPANGVINGGSDGCILISGTPAASTAGSYTVSAAVSINTNFGVFPATMTWPLTVNAVSGIATVSATSGVLLLTPNPAGTQLNLAADFHFTKISVFDALGNLSMTQEVNSVYKTSLDLGKLNAGIYFVQVIDGNKVVTRKFIKE